MALAIHLTRQIANAAALLLAVLVLNFCLIHLAPGDPVQVIAGEMGAPRLTSLRRSGPNTGSTTA